MVESTSCSVRFVPVTEFHAAQVVPERPYVRCVFEIISQEGWAPIKLSQAKEAVGVYQHEQHSTETGHDLAPQQKKKMNLSANPKAKSYKGSDK